MHCRERFLTLGVCCAVVLKCALIIGPRYNVSATSAAIIGTDVLIKKLEAIMSIIVKVYF